MSNFQFPISNKIFARKNSVRVSRANRGFSRNKNYRIFDIGIYLKLEIPALQAGFTYIELILYTAIVTIVLSSLIPFAWNVIGGGVKSSTQQEVFANARFISERIKYEIRNATGINSVSPGTISLVTSISSTNPTIIDLNSGNIRVTQGAGGAVNLNSQNTSISSLTFTNYTSADNKTKHIQFAFTLLASFAGAGSRQEFKESTTIESSAEVRSN